MTLDRCPVEKHTYGVNGRKIVLDSDLVQKYSDIVCPVTEEYLIGMIHVFGKNCQDDDVMSYKIAADMAQELHEYGY